MVKKTEFVTTREAAKQLGVSLRTIQLWVESGVLSAWKTAGGHRRVAQASLEEVLYRQKEAVGFSSKVRTPSSDEVILLVVEDSSEQLTLYRRHIQSWNLPIRLITAVNGFEGLYLIGQYEPDYIISDLEMPGMDGLQMVWSLYEQPDVEYRDLLVITALTLDEIKKKGGLPEGVPVMHKPIRFDELQSIISKKVRKKLNT